MNNISLLFLLVYLDLFCSSIHENYSLWELFLLHVINGSWDFFGYLDGLVTWISTMWLTSGVHFTALSHLFNFSSKLFNSSDMYYEENDYILRLR